MAKAEQSQTSKAREGSMVIDQADYDTTKKKKIEVKEPCQETNGVNQPINQELYGLVKSDTHYGAYYLITGKENLNCSCPGKNCKHLREIQNGNRACIRIARSVSEEDAGHNRE